MSFSLIAAVGKNGELGKEGGLIFQIPEDMKFFREKTLGRTVVMGRKTFESIGRELPGRKNVILTHGGINADDFIKENLESSEEIFVIGGGEIYRKFLPVAEKIYLTEIMAEAEADTYFPEFDKSLYSRKILGEGESRGLKYQFVLYERKSEGAR